MSCKLLLGTLLLFVADALVWGTFVFCIFCIVKLFGNDPVDYLPLWLGSTLGYIIWDSIRAKLLETCRNMKVVIK